MKKIKYINFLLPLLVFLLLLELLIFARDSISMVSETNRNNFEYTVKVRNSIEEVDKIVERAGVNLNMFASVVRETYDVNNLYNKSYNQKYLKKIDVFCKTTLINSPGVNGSWFQLSYDIPFASKLYAWYILKDGKIVDYRAELNKTSAIRRKINPQDDPYYFEAIKNRTTTWSNIYVDRDEQLKLITISQPIYKNNKLVGVVGIDISVQNLQNALMNMQDAFPGSEVFLLDSKLNVVLAQLSDNQDLRSKKYPFLELFINRNDGDGMVQYIDNGVSKSAIMLSLSNKYHIVISFQNMDILKGYNRLFKTIYVIFAIMVVLAIIALINKARIININKKLKDEKEKLMIVLESSPNIVMLKNLNGVYLDCNKAFTEIMGIPKEDVIGKTDHDLFQESDTEEMLKNDELVKSTKKTLVQESYFIGKNRKTVCIEKYVVPLLDSEKNLIGLFILGIDITKRKDESIALQKAKDDAEKSTVIKSNFLANMSHEIRTPMNGVLGFMQLLKETNLTEEQNELLSDAQKSSEILLDIINDILDFSKIEADKLSLDKISFNIRSIVHNITIMYSVSAEKKALEINSLICSDVPQTVFGDPHRIEQILGNLVNNAIKFTQKGEIIINVKQILEDENNSLICFEVKDTGIGIEKEKLNLIFEEFTQADSSTTRKYGGTGLGLAISKRLVSLMGGTLSVKSEVGKGSTFTLILQFKKDPNANLNINKNIKELSGKKIILILDSETDFKVVHYYLSEVNCIIYEATSIKDSLNMLNDDISLILIGDKIKTSNELDFNSLIQLNKLNKNIPMILCTSFVNRETVSIDKENGFSGYLAKPITQEGLIETLVQVINNSTKGESENSVLQKINIEDKFIGNVKILVVEDSKLNCKLILKILEKHGLFSDVVNDGLGAINLFKSNKYDLILMDCQMPIMNGYEATNEIRKIEGTSSHVPIIAMTANALANDDKKCFEAGMDDYISKPIIISNLLKTIGKYIPFDAGTTVYHQSESENHEYIENIIKSIVTELEFTRDEAVDIFAEYLRVFPQSYTELKQVIGKNDFEMLKKLGHKLKGSSSNLRITELTQLSTRLEEVASKEDKESCLKCIDEIKNYIDELDYLFLKFIKID